VVLSRQPHAGAEGEDGAGASLVFGVNQPAGVAGHRGAVAFVGRPGAAQGGWADQRHGRHQLLPPPHPTSPGPSPPGHRVLGAIRPHPGHGVQGLQGGDDGSRETTYSASVSTTGRAPRHSGCTAPPTR
jgi:hypothetical protein